MEVLRERYKAELEEGIPQEIEQKIDPESEILLRCFPQEIIEYADLHGQWEVILHANLPSLLDVESKWIRMYVIHALYKEVRKRPPTAAPTPEPKKTREDDQLTSPEEGAVTQEAPKTRMEDRTSSHPRNRIARKSTMYRCTIPTTNGDASCEFIGTIPPVDGLETDIEVDSVKKRIVIKRCMCAFQTGTALACICTSSLDKHLVVREVVKSRPPQLGKRADILVHWRPFIENGKTYPPSWLAMDILEDWCSRPLMSYFSSRVFFELPPSSSQ
jgi:hypothetical protein